MASGSEDTADSGNSGESGQESENVYSEGLAYELNSDDDSYTVVGIGSFKGTELRIPILRPFCLASFSTSPLVQGRLFSEFVLILL